MAQLDDLGEIITTDVLVIGGGLAGLSSALKAKEQPVEVLVVDKGTIGWSGQTTKAGNGLWVMGPDDDIETFVEYHVRNQGEYLNDQELLRLFAQESYKAAEQLIEWGVQITRDAKGNIGRFRHPLGPWSITGIELEVAMTLKKQALKRGIRLVDKVQITDLLTENGRVVGAIGFNLIDMRFYIFKAKATILASCGCSFGLMGMFTGEGEATTAAYRAGAEMRNAEITTAGLWGVKSGQWIAGREYSLYNVLGENMAMKYDPKTPDVSRRLILGMEKELMEGRGPLYVDMAETNEFRRLIGPEEEMMNGMVRFFPQKLSWDNRRRAKGLKYAPPGDKMEVVLVGLGHVSPVKTDHDMKTTASGLWAAGSVNWQASAWIGARVAPGGVRGTGLGHAQLSGLRAGVSAARSALETTQGAVDAGEVKQLKDNLFAPLARDKGVLPAQVIGMIAGVVVPVDQVLRRHKDRMEKALETVAEIQAMLPALMAKDGHGLSKCIESQGIVVNTEMMHRAALMRTESRGDFYREDYPERDDKNWLKWTIVKQEAGKMAVSTEPVPIEKYKYRP